MLKRGDLVFIVLLTPAIPDHLRGYLSRFLIEPRANVFLGNVSSRVRDRIWERAASVAGADNLTMIHTARNEQGFEMRFHGDRSPRPIDLDGYQLVARPQAAENPDALS